jgi:hypothetical protein
VSWRRVLVLCRGALLIGVAVVGRKEGKSYADASGFRMSVVRLSL